jgi:hypothetical protein
MVVVAASPERTLFLLAAKTSAVRIIEFVQFAGGDITHRSIAARSDSSLLSKDRMYASMSAM